MNWIILLEVEINKEYIVKGAKDSNDANQIASKTSSELLWTKTIPDLGMEMNVIFIKSGKVDR